MFRTLDGSRRTLHVCKESALRAHLLTTTYLLRQFSHALPTLCRRFFPSGAVCSCLVVMASCGGGGQVRAGEDDVDQATTSDNRYHHLPQSTSQRGAPARKCPQIRKPRIRKTYGERRASRAQVARTFVVMVSWVMDVGRDGQLKWTRTGIGRKDRDACSIPPTYTAITHLFILFMT